MVLRMSLNNLSKGDRRELYAELSKEFGRPRATRPGLKEEKLKAAAKVLATIHQFTTPQQRQILKFAMEMVQRANDKFWRDNDSAPES